MRRLQSIGLFALNQCWIFELRLLRKKTCLAIVETCDSLVFIALGGFGKMSQYLHTIEVTSSILVALTRKTSGFELVESVLTIT